MAGKLAGVPSKDLEAKIKEQEDKLNKFLMHVDHLNPINMFWDEPPFLGRAREYIDGGAKLKDYFGFDITEILTAPEHSARIIVEYKGKVILNLFYQDHYKPLPSGMSERVREIRVDACKKGKWDAAFDKIIDMHPSKAAELYRQQFEEIERVEEKKRLAEEEIHRKQLERSRLECKAYRLGL